MNAPYVSFPYCYNQGIAHQNDDFDSICVGDLGPYAGNLTQVGYKQQDLSGTNTRRLGPNYSRWNQQDVYWNVHGVPNGLTAFTRIRWASGVTHAELLNVLPPYPGPDGVVRNSFLPASVAIDPPGVWPAKNAIVEFGYAENGDPAKLYCTSRQETCVAASASINLTTPFYFEQTDTYAGVPCSGGCTITIPALSQRVVYYRWKYLNAAGVVVGPPSSLHVAITP